MSLIQSSHVLQTPKMIFWTRLSKKSRSITTQSHVGEENRMIVHAVPLSNDMNDDEKKEKLQVYRDIITKVKTALESPNVDENQEIEDFLKKLNII